MSKKSMVMRNLPPAEIKAVETLAFNFDDAKELGGKIFYSAQGDAQSAATAPALKEESNIRAVKQETNILLDHDIEMVRAEAFQDGASNALERITQPIQAFSNAVVEISRLRESLLKSNLEEMVQLVMAVSEQVIGAEIETRPELIQQIITDALKSAIDADEFHIRVNAADLKTVTELKPMLLTRINTLKNVTVEADETVLRGGCILESALGDVDATLGSKMEQIRAHLMQHIVRHEN